MIKLTAEAKKAGSPEELNLREGSARYVLMAYIYRNAAKNPKGYTREQIAKVVGDQTGQALRGMLRYGFLVEVE